MIDNINFFSVCSGIEAASVAWTLLGWTCAGVSEIEKFPSAVLAHHYPDVTNHGDFTKIDVTTLGRIDIFCGGTPCQAFSVAGLRNSLDDARGNLSLEFVRLAHELADGNGLRNVVWENVPGVLNTKDNAFGCFLGGLVGADDAIPPPPGRNGKRNTKWPDAGMVAGPRGRAAWRILDAQYFGLAQRRKRVIVVADFGNGADPAAVLFERVGMQGNSAPSREKREGIAPTISARTKGGGGLGTDFDLDGGLIEAVAYGGNRCSGPIDIAPAVNAHGGPHGRQDFESEAFLVHAIQAGALRTNPTSGPDGVGVQADIAYTLEARAEVQAVSQCVMPINTMIATRHEALGERTGFGIGEDGDPAFTLTKGHSHAVCVTGTVTHTLKTEGADASEDGTGRGTPIVAFTQNQREEVREIEIAGSLSAEPGTHQQTFVAQAYAFQPRIARNGRGDMGDIAPCVAISYPVDLQNVALGDDITETLDTTRPGRGGGQAVMVPIDGVRYGPSNQDTLHHESGVLNTLPGGTHGNGGHFTKTVASSAVRRLTPKECERLQGFPDGYTDIPWRGKPNSPDGPRYKALGNSWAVPKFRWLGERIQRLLPPLAANDNTPQATKAA